MDTAIPQKFPFILDRNLAKANCTEDRVCTSCDKLVLGYCICSLKEKMESFWPKKLSHFSELKFGPKIPSNWRIFESNWLDIESQFYPNILQLLMQNSGSNFSSASDTTFKVKMIPIFLSVLIMELMVLHWIVAAGVDDISL